MSSAADLFTNIEIFPTKNSDKVLAFGSVLIGGIAKVSVSIRKGSNGIFASLPGHSGRGKDKDGNQIDNKWYNDVFLPDKNVREQFQKAVVAAYQAKVGGQQSAGEENQDNSLPF